MKSRIELLPAQRREVNERIRKRGNKTHWLCFMKDGEKE
jgi:hypothetical protein